MGIFVSPEGRGSVPFKAVTGPLPPGSLGGAGTARKREGSGWAYRSTAAVLLERFMLCPLGDSPGSCCPACRHVSVAGLPAFSFCVEEVLWVLLCRHHLTVLSDWALVSSGCWNSDRRFSGLTPCRLTALPFWGSEVCSESHRTRARGLQGWPLP